MAGDFESKGWPNTDHTAYGVSKIGVTAMTIIQQKEFDKETERADIVVNAVSAVHPSDCWIVFKRYQHIVYFLWVHHTHTAQLVDIRPRGRRESF